MNEFANGLLTGFVLGVIAAGLFAWRAVSQHQAKQAEVTPQPPPDYSPTPPLNRKRTMWGN